jgi:nicotinate-nucleotide adenylyltransferase
LRIGLLGGSFNPAHDGHRHISLLALKRLNLDYVWWLVSPQNPLKSAKNMSALSDRLAAAQKVARHPRIRVRNLEAELGTNYTADTLRHVLALHPATRFIWIMGADNMVQLPKWRRWRHIICNLPIAVFDRPHYFLRANSGKAAGAYRRRRVSGARIRRLGCMKPPAWAFVHIPLSGLSATRIRAERRKITTEA